MEPSNSSGILSLPTLPGNGRMSSPKLLYIPDLITVSVFLLTWAWFTDGWGLWAPKPDPLLFVPVRDWSSYKKAPTKSRNIAEALKDLDLVVFWGSQSGRAERLAASFTRDCTGRFGLRVAAADLDDYDPQHLTELSSTKVVVFIVSTFGEGDPTDNAVKFFSLLKGLRDAGKPELLKNLRYAAFGLGNRNYKHYNKMVDVVDQTLKALGAKNVVTVGKADEAEGPTATDEHFLEWSSSATETIRRLFGVEEQEVSYAPEFSIIRIDATADKDNTANASPINPRSAGLAASLTIARDLTNSPDRQCLHVEFDLSSRRSMKYQAGDHLLVWPQNSVDEVERLCRLLGLSEEERNETVDISPRIQGKSPGFPSPTTRKAILHHHLDISGPVSRDALRLLVEFAPTRTAQEFLSSLAKDAIKFRTLVSSSFLSLGKVMQLACDDRTWDKLPFSFLLDCLGKLKPRYYSIATSPTVSPLQPAITLAITRKTSDPDAQFSRFYGVASNYLLAVSRNLGQQPITDGPNYGVNDNKVLVQIVRSTFKLPRNPLRPIIMIAAGTGIAPFRAFVQERASIAARGLAVGPALLLFGCRSPTEDFLYSEEWAGYARRLPGFEFINAFSRHDEKKVYVQDKLMDEKEKIAALLEQDAVLYVCGSADMARGVRRALIRLFVEMKGWPEEQAERHVMGEMKKTKQLLEDIWSG
ncbi:NADPH--cytochrome P450 reductase [Aspergillus udagawae]|uniref:NADPH--cytochrome P450 reductase n=1 Tax=Aspergillus udagawae TaxID=91492 RepID=A0A8H3RRB1_9EURO|nr:NADPH--cytochrome P450 reductase [Aspergillus udagawae]